MELKDTLLFQNLNDTEIQRILYCSHAETLTFPKGQTIIFPDDKPAVLYLILEGTVILEQYNYMGKPHEHRIPLCRQSVRRNRYFP